MIQNNNNNFPTEKTFSIPIKTKKKYKNYSKSWNGYSSFQCGKNNISFSLNDNYSKTNHKIQNNIINNYKQSDNTTNYKYLNLLTNHGSLDQIKKSKPYDAVNNCKSAGIIPYTFFNGKLYFLLQKAKNPFRKKDFGWNDFGGKKITPNESTADTAAREFSEETSCLFYLAEQKNDISLNYFNLLKNNENLSYNENCINILKNIIPLSQKYFSEKITEYVLPIFVSSKETYISYFIKVEYIFEKNLPMAEDIHIPYQNRYIRTCKWFSMDEIMELDEQDFHKRLQITKIQQRINNFYEKKLFT